MACILFYCAICMYETVMYVWDFIDWHLCILLFAFICWMDEWTSQVLLLLNSRPVYMFLWFQTTWKCLISSLQFNSVTQSCPTLCDPMNRSTPGLSVHHHLPEFTQTHVHQVHDAIQPSHPLSSPSPPAPNFSQHQSLFQWVNSSHEMAKVLEFQL